MMRNLGPCPKCQEDELRLSRAGNQIWLHCYECGWDSGIVTLALRPSSDDIDAAIAAVVAAARQPVSAPIATEPSE